MQSLRERLENASRDSKTIVPPNDDITPNEARNTQSKGNTDGQTQHRFCSQTLRKSLSFFLQA